MKKLIPTLILTPALLIGCGMSDEEKANVAAVTCSVMSETRNMDSAIRVREMNAAREKIGEAPYLAGDEVIKQSFEWGMCEELVLNDPSYAENLEERVRVAIEEARIADKKREEEDRIAEEKRKKRVKEAQEKWHAAIASDLQDASPVFLSANYNRDRKELTVEFTCNKLEGYKRTVVAVFEDKLGIAKVASHTGRCGYDGKTAKDTFKEYHGIRGIKERALNESNDPTKLIKEIYIQIWGVYDLSPVQRMRRLKPTTYPPLKTDSTLVENPIRIDVKM